MMKRILLTFLTFFLFVGFANAAGTCTVSGPSYGNFEGIRTSVALIRVDCTADAADQSYPDTTIERVGGYLIAVYFIPGTVTVPTNLMDMTVELGSTGFDLMGGAAADLVTSANATITPLVGEVSAPAGFSGDLIVKLANNSVNSATLTYWLMIDHSKQ